MKHDYTNDEIRDAWKDSVSLCEFLDALPERPQAAEIASLKDSLLQAQEAAKDLLAQHDKVQAELAALRTPIQSDAGIRLGQVAEQGYNDALEGHVNDSHEYCMEAAAQAVAAVVEARMIRRMEAVPVEELDNIYFDTTPLPEGDEDMKAVRTRLIAAAKGEGQAQAKPSTRIEITEIPDKKPGPVGTLAYAPQAEEPAWIPHDGGPCPLKDEEVEEWEFRMVKEYPDKVFTRTAGQLPSAISWNVVTHYRVTKPAPGHGPQAASKEVPATFTGSDGKTYNRHTPGDPCPCDPEASVQCLTSISGPTSAGKATYFGWKVSVHDENHWGVIIGWRYADEPSQAEAISTEPEDKRLPPLNEADPVGHCAVEAACVHRKLDELGIPREEGGDELSLWGRVEEYAKAQPTQLQQAWTPAVGDTVRLKSGGPVMTVVDSGADDGLWPVCWFSEGIERNEVFPTACLTPAQP